ncbi:MAG TPA: hypothetical protein VI279_17000, partial [Rhodocyclaceae bacterium]
MARALRLIAAFLPLCLALAGCGRLDPPEKNGELVVAIRSGPSSYQLEDGKANGFEHDMVQAFA